MPADVGRQPEPACREDAQQVPVREEKNVASGAEDAVDDGVSPSAHVVERSPSGMSVVQIDQSGIRLRMSAVVWPSQTP